MSRSDIVAVAVIAACAAVGGGVTAAVLLQPAAAHAPAYLVVSLPVDVGLDRPLARGARVDVFKGDAVVRDVEVVGRNRGLTQPVVAVWVTSEQSATLSKAHGSVDLLLREPAPVDPAEVQMLERLEGAQRQPTTEVLRGREP
jgi:hypothetical protein